MPPPPQETIEIVTPARSSRDIPRIICFLSKKRTIENNIPTANTQLEAGWKGCCKWVALVGAVVLTVTVAMVVAATPPGLTDAGENKHAASEGNPEQARVMVPLKFVEFEMAKEVLSELPGVWISMPGWPARVMKNPGETVNVSGWVELLPLKLRSPA